MTTTTAAGQSSSADTNKELVRHVFEAGFERGDFEDMSARVAPDYLVHAVPPGTPRGAAGLISVVEWLRGAFSELRLDFGDFIAEGDKVAVRLTLHGRHTGAFMGQPATGRQVDFEQIHILRLEHGKVAEHWACRDDIAAMSQLGILPHPPPQPDQRRVPAAASDG